MADHLIRVASWVGWEFMGPIIGAVTESCPSPMNVYTFQVKSKIFHYNSREMYVNKSTRLKPILDYLSHSSEIHVT